MLKSLKEKDVFYLKADKGNQLVILNKSDYHKRMKEMILSSNDTQLNQNPINHMVKSANKIIAKVNEVFKIPKLVLSISNPIVPRIYGLPKIHKP